ncbi:MAG: cutinase, partial [Mycobacterium sp.]|nr:cutinase [Mycobacterium sp.]
MRGGATSAESGIGGAPRASTRRPRSVAAMPPSAPPSAPPTAPMPARAPTAPAADRAVERRTGAPPIAVGHLYTGKTTDICIPTDPICAPGGTDNGAHTQYAVNGLTGQAADYAARRLTSSGATT